MKKIIAIFICVVILMISCCGCNMGMGLGSFTFNKVHIHDYAGHCSHLTVEKWYESETGIEVNTKEQGSLYLSEGTYILYSDDCPLCDNKE